MLRACSGTWNWMRPMGRSSRITRTIDSVPNKKGRVSGPFCFLFRSVWQLGVVVLLLSPTYQLFQAGSASSAGALAVSRRLMIFQSASSM